MILRYKISKPIDLRGHRSNPIFFYCWITFSFFSHFFLFHPFFFSRSETFLLSFISLLSPPHATPSLQIPAIVGKKETRSALLSSPSFFPINYFSVYPSLLRRHHRCPRVFRPNWNRLEPLRQSIAGEPSDRRSTPFLLLCLALPPLSRGSNDLLNSDTSGSSEYTNQEKAEHKRWPKECCSHDS